MPLIIRTKNAIVRKPGDRIMLNGIEIIIVGRTINAGH
jgi:hypothetical protein